jgi:phosphate transport system substrate-binding protein
MLRKRKVRSLLAASAVLAAVSGTAFAQTAPVAKADPQTTLVAVGSDTIQDVWNAFTNGTPAGNGQTAVPAALAAGLVASYNATNPATGAINEAITPTDGWAVTQGTVPNPNATHPLAPGDCSFARPNGSGQGIANLRLALNAASTHATAAIQPAAGLGCVDIARSSSTVDTTDTNTAVDIQFVPFAIDAVTAATGPSSCTPATNCPSFTADLGNGTTLGVTTVANTLGTDIGSITLTQLQSLYNCNPVTVGATTYWPTGSATAQPTGSTAIDLYVPQAGSGTRKFWEGTSAASFPDSEVDAATNGCVHDFIINGVLAQSTTQTVKVPVEEHDGTAVSTDPIGYDPFSIAQYISQQNPQHSPRFHGAVLQDINSVSPFVTAGTPSSGLNTSFPILRDVYDVVKLSRLTTAGDPIDTLFNGVGSTICKQKPIITSYGFALMGAAVFNGLTCGTIQTSLEGAP